MGFFSRGRLLMAGRLLLEIVSIAVVFVRKFKRDAEFKHAVLSYIDKIRTYA
jgi:hypothetical protein